MLIRALVVVLTIVSNNQMPREAIWAPAAENVLRDKQEPNGVVGDLLTTLKCFKAKMKRRKPRPERLASKFMELAFAVPQVIVHRTSRMISAGVSPSRHDRAEFWRMGIEKVDAFYRSWLSIWLVSASVQSEMAQNLASTMYGFASGKYSGPNETLDALSDAAIRLISAGLVPVHKKAVSNAKRLSRLKRKNAALVRRSNVTS